MEWSSETKCLPVVNEQHIDVPMQKSLAFVLLVTTRVAAGYGAW